MKHVTRDIEPASAHDLLRRVPRVCICFADDGRPHAQPVTLVWHDNCYQIGVPASATSLPTRDQEVVLLVDEGVYFYDLRAIYIRGVALPIQAPAASKAGYAWFELTPSKIVAWDYGAMREVDNDEHG